MKTQKRKTTGTWRLAALALTALALPAAADLEAASTAFQAGEYTKVIEHAEAAAADAADAPKLWYLAGEAQLVLARPVDAERSFRAVLAKRPEAVPAHVGLARALTGQGGEAQLDEAERVLGAVLKQTPKEVAAKAALGELYARTDRLSAAKEELASALELAPGDPFVVRPYFEIMLQAEDAGAAAEAVEAFAGARPEHPLGPFLLAVVMERDGEHELAVQQYQAALEMDANYLDAHKNLAILCHTMSNTYQNRERTELAYRHYERYFELGGSDPQLRTMYDDLLRFKDQILGG